MKTILFVDDEELTQLMVKIYLEGFDVITASHGRQGIDLAQAHRPDLIICDIMMPDMDGYDVLNAIRSHRDLAATPFIFLTALGNEHYRTGMDASADDFLGKPFTKAQLLGAVQAAFFKQDLRSTTQPRTITNPLLFLSYSRQDMAVMERVRDSLRRQGFAVWTDEKLEPGTPEWEKSLSDALKRSAAVVVLLSPDAEQSKWVGRELAMAEKINLRIFPLLARGDETNAIPILLISHQWIDIRHDYSTGLEKLVTALRNFLNIT
jgi:CheY-like chemotaxis protein